MKILSLRVGRPGRSSGAVPLALLVLVGGMLTACRSAPESADPAPAAEPEEGVEEPGPRVVQPGAPGAGSRALDAGEPRGSSPAAHTEADVRFMQNMIHHHAQALEMSRLATDRTDSRDIRSLARRIQVSQADEIALMENWLEKRGEEVPDLDHPHHHGHDAGHHDHRGHEAGEDDGPALMAGMLTPEQMAELEAAEGEEFDRLFLQFMIFHHEGALIMVDELMSSPGSAREPEIFQFAAHVESDQGVEISRMRRLLAARR